MVVRVLLRRGPEGSPCSPVAGFPGKKERGRFGQMLLQTNSYVVPRDKREEHERLIRRIRQAMLRIGCEQFEVYEQVGANWAAQKGGRFIQIMRFRDRQHHREIQEAEKSDPGVQQLISQFMELVDLPEQQVQGSFVMGYFSRVAGGAEMQGGSAPVTQQRPGEHVGPVRELEMEHEDDGSGNNKPVKHEESEF